MNTRLTTLLAALAVVTLVSPLKADASGFLSEFTASLNEPSGMIHGEIGRVTQDIYPVSFTYINGRRVTGQRSTLWLKPGEYRIEGIIRGTRSMRSVPGGTRTQPKSAQQRIEPLELVVEEGMAYHIGGLHLYDKEGARRMAWKLVVWKVEDEENGSHYPLDEEQDEDESEAEPEDI